MEKIIIVNSGSVSAKYGFYQDQNEILFCHYEKDNDKYLLIEKNETSTKKQTIQKDIYEKSFNDFIGRLIDRKIIQDKNDISVVAFRVVSPGKFFTEHRFVDLEFLQMLEKNKSNSPIHIEKLQKEIEVVKNILPSVKMVAISDTAFHSTHRDSHAIYSLPKKLIEKYELYRFGYHGLSVESAVDYLKEKRQLGEKVVVCHLGGGSSVSGVKKGKSIYNSMGYSPLSGIIMSSRTGDLDPEVMLKIMEHEKLTVEQIRDLVAHKSGILGISEISDDIRDLIELMEDGNQDARLAVENYVWGVKRAIGVAVALLDGIDTLIFTGTIGVRSYKIRKMICSDFNYLKLYIDENKNKLIEAENAYINSPNSEVKIFVYNTEEVKKIAENAMDLIGG